MAELRDLPSVDALLKTRQGAELDAVFGRPLTLEAIRLVLGEVRGRFVREGGVLPQKKAILHAAKERLDAWTQPSLVPVINATGVILHTNLGRAPLSAAALQAVEAASRGYANLEYVLEKGTRGSRLSHADELLTHLTGAEAALIVNNNAAAVLLALTALARRRRVIISRTQLVEIGGGFRVPDVMSQSGARLVEVGTTNRVHLADYEEALQDPPALVLHAHPSNFRIIGFTSEPTLSEVVRAAHAAGVPMVDDLGSGALLDTGRFGLGHEPMVQESLAAGVDLVCFSGDKLLGGPQAGILLGRRELIAKLKRHPLARALRADKLCLAALSATLLHYLRDEAERTIPVWQMISKTPEQNQACARRWAEVLGQGEVIPGESTVGGGSLPGETLPTFLLALRVEQPTLFTARLREARTPVIARVEANRVLLDPRTVFEGEEAALVEALGEALAGSMEISK